MHLDVPNGVNPGAGVTVAPNPAARDDAYAKLRRFLRAEIGASVMPAPTAQPSARSDAQRSGGDGADLIGCEFCREVRAEGKARDGKVDGSERARAGRRVGAPCSSRGGAAAQSLAPDIVVVKTINAPVADVWKAWTTTDGIESFFAPKAAKVEPWPGGAFELWFGVDMAEGSRGSEDCKVHSVKPMEQFVFEWNAPPTIPGDPPAAHARLPRLQAAARQPHRSDVAQLRLRRRRGLGKTKVYFERAWPAVMANLEKRFQPK